MQIAFGRDTLVLSDLMTVFLIRDNIGKRPIYFSWSDGGFADQLLGLTGYLTTEGLVRKLHNGPLDVAGPIVINRSLGYVELERTRKLLFETYNYDAASRARPFGWVDRPSQSILSLYSVIYGAASSSITAAGDTALGQRSDSIASAVEANLER